ncbi:uncharacterized protein CMU_019280 [Cryptosporidium muris RN66]|uniref:PH domain-containing protein n=1 Tax=Cryptosporidium muris (strain RN66) TaxID=441375 RepID=B6ACB5_CRYMR|nr:uncharacterized protein CMU_019280 [Cryptosporidium muris RN66]EEA06171.1 hypothetical protein, conserved [Cryptosporidium muris RN66]|eukprot:XP_002140520.1 hypothetical protein [Cryptosporidium muris RN66]
MVKLSVLGLLFAVVGAVRGAKTELGISSSVIGELKGKGYTNSDIESLVGTIRSALLSVHEDNQISACGEGLRGLLDRQLLPGDPDAMEKVTGIIHNSNFQLYRGKIAIVTLTPSSITLPIDTLNDRCFGIRTTSGIAYNICATDRNMRNIWINAITELVLCKTTGVRTGRLPTPSLKQNILASTNLGNVGASGINIFVKDSNEGKPFVTINGKPISKIIEQQAMAAEKAISEVPGEDYDEDLLNFPTEILGSSSNDIADGSTLSDAEKLAIQESEAEHLMLPINEAPPVGYASLHMGNSKTRK